MFQFIDTPKDWEDRQTPWESWLQAVLTSEGRREGVFVYRFFPDEELLQLNVKFLQHDTLTDVITFDKSRGVKASADIAISHERIRENAEKEGVQPSQEADRVVLHAALHVCGYKDKTREEEKEMRLLEEKYLLLRPKQLFHV